MNEARRDALAKGATAFVVLTLSGLFAGLFGLAVATAGLAVAWVAGARWVAGAAFVALALAAAATVTVSLASDPGAKIEFADDRRLASDAARAAGVLTLVAVVGFAERERARRVAVRDAGEDEERASGPGRG